MAFSRRSQDDTSMPGHTTLLVNPMKFSLSYWDADAGGFLSIINTASRSCASSGGSTKDHLVSGSRCVCAFLALLKRFQPGSFGYRPKKPEQTALQRASTAILEGKTHVIDLG